MRRTESSTGDSENVPMSPTCFVFKSNVMSPNAFADSWSQYPFCQLTPHRWTQPFLGELPEPSRTRRGTGGGRGAGGGACELVQRAQPPRGSRRCISRCIPRLLSASPRALSCSCCRFSKSESPKNHLNENLHLGLRFRGTENTNCP